MAGCESDLFEIARRYILKILRFIVTLCKVTRSQKLGKCILERFDVVRLKYVIVHWQHAPWNTVVRTAVSKSDGVLSARSTMRTIQAQDLTTCENIDVKIARELRTSDDDKSWLYAGPAIVLYATHIVVIRESTGALSNTHNVHAGNADARTSSTRHTYRFLLLHLQGRIKGTANYAANFVLNICFVII